MKHERLSIEEWKRRFDNPKFCSVRHMADPSWDRVQNNQRYHALSSKRVRHTRNLIVGKNDT